MMNIITHLQEHKTDRNNAIMTIALLAILVYSSFIFGLGVFASALVAIVVSVAVEYGFHRVRKSPFGYDLLITPLLLTLLVTPTLPLWMLGVGSFFGTFFAKSVFGGQGAYIFHPAVAGVLFLMVTFPAQVNTSWLNPVTDTIQTFRPIDSLQFIPSFTADGLPIAFGDMLYGYAPGATGETVRIGILIIGLVLMLLKVIDWKLTVGFLASMFVLQVVFNLFAGPFDPIFGLFTGTAIFASVFLVTDPVVVPRHTYGRLLYVVGVALFTIIIRMFSAFPEGIIFALIIMSSISPLLDKPFEKEVLE
jgi:Na+-transporting NADH:ubiquinone oxidoreductase subunit B/electron transport complex protein RnfD